MHWGYYCRTCGKSSESIFQDPDSLFAAYREANVHGSRGADDDTLASDALNIQCLLFLVLHDKHEMWAECETGVLRLGGMTTSAEGGGLPQRFQPQS